MIIDTHSHVQTYAFKEDQDEVIKKTLTKNVWMINVGTKFHTSQAAVQLAENYQEGVFAAVGLHPMYAGAKFIKIKHDPSEEESLIEEHTFDKEKYKELAKSKKVVAIGEIGLDYYYKPKTVAKLAEFKAKQKQVFLEQLELAYELQLPVILHCRMAHDDVIEILKTQKNHGGVIHCFTGTLEQAQQYVALGFHIGINGIIFKFNIDEVIKTISLDSMVVETDCPYLTPPEAPEKRNQPLYITYTLERIAELKGTSFEEVCEKTTQNARKLFKI
jgi:TatD DNase family protein